MGGLRRMCRRPRSWLFLRDLWHRVADTGRFSGAGRLGPANPFSPRVPAEGRCGARQPDGKGRAGDGACGICRAKRGQPLQSLLGGERERVPVGVSVGLQASPQALVETVAGYLAQGYRRIKIKIKPGRDVEDAAAVRQRLSRYSPAGGCQLGLHTANGPAAAAAGRAGPAAHRAAPG